MTTVRLEGTKVQIIPAGATGPTLVLSVEDWRSLNRTVETVIGAAYLSYDDALTLLGIHRSTLGDWIARGKVDRVVIAGRGYVVAKSISTHGEVRSGAHRPLPSATTSSAARKLQEIVPSQQDSVSTADRHETSGTQVARPGTEVPLESATVAATVAVSELQASAAVVPDEFPAGRVEALSPGLYAWWADGVARAILSDVLGAEVPELLYVGQAGATSRNGVRSSATLASRIRYNHINGNIGSSTFRYTISSLLAGPLDLTVNSHGRLDAANNSRVSSWIKKHLRISITAIDDRELLCQVEKDVVTQLDPPLNLAHCARTGPRERISFLRHQLTSK